MAPFFCHEESRTLCVCFSFLQKNGLVSTSSSAQHGLTDQDQKLKLQEATRDLKHTIVPLTQLSDYTSIRCAAFSNSNHVFVMNYEGSKIRRLNIKANGRSYIRYLAKYNRRNILWMCTALAEILHCLCIIKKSILYATVSLRNSVVTHLENLELHQIGVPRMPSLFHLTNCSKCSTPEQLLFVVDVFFFLPFPFSFCCCVFCWSFRLSLNQLRNCKPLQTSNL